MRALRYDHYGPAENLRVVELPDPDCQPDRFRIRVRAGSLNPLDWKLRSGHLSLMPGVERPPRGLGCDFAGEIVAVGAGPPRFHRGQHVFGTLPPFERQGALAELICVGSNRIAALPASLTCAEAAALPIAAGTAVQALEDHAGLTAGQSLLVTGAAGGVGHFAVQLGVHLGAVVAGVCNAANVDFVRALGANRVFDYAREDFCQGDTRYDVIFDAACSSSYAACRRVLAADGIYLNTSGSGGVLVRTLVASVFARVATRQRAVALALKTDARSLERLARYAGAGVLRPHFAPPIGLSEVVAAQHAMESGHGRGKIVVAIGHSDWIDKKDRPAR
jgi:NADPH:quinone reductase-like Zn-dependent oxidoreductase